MQRRRYTATHTRKISVKSGRKLIVRAKKKKEGVFTS
jgi:hypothetical protein